MSKLAYPKGRLLLVRDCTVDICLKNNPGAVLLSVLLFWYDNPHKGDWENEGLHEFCMCRTQAEIEEASCHQIDVKTIHDTAIPLLRLLGYLHVGKKMNGDLYVLHMDRVIASFAAYEQSLKQHDPAILKNHIRSLLQLESALIEMTEYELESALINKSRLYRLLERTLIRIREDSNCKRGPKTRPQQVAEAVSENIEIIRDSIEIYTKREESAFAPLSLETSEENDVLTERFPDGNLRIYRKSGKSIGELIPIGTDTSEGLRELITVEGSLEEEDETVKHKAVRPNETPYHIAEGAIGNDEEEDTESPVLTGMQFKQVVKLNGASHAPMVGNLPADRDSASVVSRSGVPGSDGVQRSGRLDRPMEVPADTQRSRQAPTSLQVQSQTQEITSEQTPGTSLPLPSAVSSPTGKHGDAGGVQATPVVSEPAQVSGGRGKQSAPKRARGKPAEVQLSLAEAQLKEWYEELRGVEVSFSKRNVTALRSLSKKDGADSKENFLNVTAILDSQKWFEENKIGVDLYWIDREWENKIIFLRGHKQPGALADKKPMDIYTAASLDPERNKRNIERLKQRILDSGGTLPS